MEIETIAKVCMWYGMVIMLATFFISLFNMMLAIIGRYLPSSSDIPLYFMAVVFIAIDAAHLLYSTVSKEYVGESYYIACNLAGALLAVAACYFVSSIQKETEVKCTEIGEKDKDYSVFKMHINILKGIKRWSMSVIVAQVIICLAF